MTLINLSAWPVLYDITTDAGELNPSVSHRQTLYLYSVTMFANVKPILLYGDRSRENSVGVHHLVVTNGVRGKTMSCLLLSCPH